MNLIKKNMAKQVHLVRIRSTESKHLRFSRRNKKQNPTKLAIKKYDPVVRKNVLYKEVKK